MKLVAEVQETVTPTDQEARLAQEASRELEAALARGAGDAAPQLRLRVGGSGAANIRVPEPALRLLIGVLREMAEGHGVLVLPVEAELTSQQAADVLRVSRPFLIKLLDQGKLPYRRVGAHRRLLARDVLRYAAEERARRERVMQELTDESERLGLYE